MGVGTNTFGYSFKPLKKVIETIKKEICHHLTLEEILLAERLIDLHEWADVARFTRTGGEANSVAIKLQGHNGKDNVANVDTMDGMIGIYINLQNKKSCNHLMRDLKIKDYLKS